MSKFTNLIKKKNSAALFLIISLAIIGVIYLLNLNKSEISVHDFNWYYVEEMNDFIIDSTFTNPPYVYDDYVHGVDHLTPLLSFFKDNLDLIYDNQFGNRISFKMYFENISGDELFIGNLPSSIWTTNNGSFEIEIYLDRRLIEGFFKYLNESNAQRFIAENPRFETIYIPFSEIDWYLNQENLREKISMFSFVTINTADDRLSSVYDFPIRNSSEEVISKIINFLRSNQQIIIEGNAHRELKLSTEEIYHYGVIFYTRINDDDPRFMTNFYLNEKLLIALIQDLGYDVWNDARLD